MFPACAGSMVLLSSLHALHTTKESSRVTNLGWWWWWGIWKHTCHACICMLNTQDSCYNQRLLKTITSHFCHWACATHRHIQNLVHFYKFKKDNVFSPLARFSDIVAWQLKAHLLIFQFGRSFWRPPEPKEKKINSAEL